MNEFYTNHIWNVIKSIILVQLIKKLHYLISFFKKKKQCIVTCYNENLILTFKKNIKRDNVWETNFFA